MKNTVADNMKTDKISAFSDEGLKELVLLIQKEVEGRLSKKEGSVDSLANKHMAELDKIVADAEELSSEIDLEFTLPIKVKVTTSQIQSKNDIVYQITNKYSGTPQVFFCKEEIVLKNKTSIPKDSVKYWQDVLKELGGSGLGEPLDLLGKATKKKMDAIQSRMEDLKKEILSNNTGAKLINLISSY